MKKYLTLISLSVTIISSAQQIGDGFASNISDLTQPIKSGIYQINSLAVNPDVSSTWQHLFVIRHSNESNNHQLQLSSSYSENDRLFFRKLARSSGQNWYELATRGTNNFSGNQIINGFVGIGNSAPDAPLTVYGKSSFYPIRSENDGGDERSFSIKSSVSNSEFMNNLYPVVLGTGGGNQPLILDAARVGIGTTNPVSKLSLAGSLTLSGGLANNLSRPLISAGTLVNGEIRGYSASGNDYDDGFLRLSAGGGTNSFVKSYIDLSGSSTMPDMNRNIVFGTDGVERMRIITNGNIGIGIKDPTNKLDVNGTIHSKEVKVDMDNWSDFVFKKEYSLPTLEEVEKHITKKGHLENIPSEKEVLQNGINLGEMNAKLLQKIEELTLYMIEQNKKIIDLQNRLEKVEIDSK